MPLEGGKFRLTGPASEVLKVWVEPRVTCSLERTATTVDVAMHETCLHAEFRGTRGDTTALLDLLNSASFTPRSSLTFAMEEEGKYRLSSTIELSVAVDLPDVPRASVRIANAAGSAALRSVCARASKQRLREIERAYFEWEAARITESESFEVVGKVVPSAAQVVADESGSYT